MRYKSLMMYFSLSHLAVYTHIKSHSKVEKNIRMVFEKIPLVGDSIIQNLWNTLKEAPPAIIALESEYQTITENLIKHIMPATKKLKIWKKRKIFEPDKIPDLSIVNYLDGELTWKNILVPVEVEAANQIDEGIGQALSYICIAMNRARRDTGICIFTDCYHISFLKAFLRRDADTPDIMETGCLQLLDNPMPTSPTDGFKLLVRFLYASPKDLGSEVEHPQQAKIGEKVFDLEGHIGSGATCEVYSSKTEDTPVAVKINNQRTIENFQREISIMDDLNRKGCIFPDFPKVVYSSPEIIVLKPLGESLLHRCCDNGGKFAIDEVCRISCQLLDILEKVHNAGFGHHDIRPSNIIFYSNKAMLIDWGSTVTLGTEESSFSGTLAFSSTKIVKSNSRGKLWTYSALDDLESLAYTLYWMLYGYLPWTKAESLGALLLFRSDLLQKIQSSVNSNKVEEFLIALFKMKSNTKVNYDQLKNIFNLNT
jgi:hypothetical protein